jgi:hypothetical protein
MKWRCILFLFFLLPALGYGFDQIKSKEIRKQAIEHHIKDYIEDYEGIK